MLLSDRLTRRTVFFNAWIAIVFLALVSEARAESRYPIKVTRVRLGLPPGPFSKEREENNEPQYLFKAAAWAPVWVDLECTAAIDQPTIEIRIDTPDGDDVMSSARIVVPSPQPGKVSGFALGRIPYLKPGGIFSELTVNIRGGAGGKQLAETYQYRLAALPPSRYMILSVGSSLPGLRLPKSEGHATSESSNENEPLRNGWVELAQITRVAELPDQWFGYAAVDLMILTTGADASFFRALAGDSKRLGAIREWVQRGGRIIVSAGVHADVLTAIPELREMLPAAILPGSKREVIEIAMSLPNAPRMILHAALSEWIPLLAVNASAGHPYQVRLFTDESKDAVPLLVQASYGLGRVTLVTFDLDLPPLIDWRDRETFWDWLINNSGARLPSGTERVAGDSRSNDDEDKYLSRMQNNLEFFEGIPVVSFGYVALLILLYILLIGPIEYLILKRLLKRLEWTWATFPIIVASVCAAAYFAAFELKGRDLKINKIDLVEIDLRSNRIYGETWFTVFSPRIQNYTIGVEPVGPRGIDSSQTAWVADSAERTLPDTLISWHGKAKTNRQSLFRRTYQYHSSLDASDRQQFADGLEQVPIQAWSTKSFVAKWTAGMSADRPLFKSTLRIAEGDPSQITGSITSNLPIELLSDAQLLYREHMTPLLPLLRGTPRYISTSPQAASAAAWLQNANTQKDLIRSNRSSPANGGDGEDSPTFRLWPVLFHDLTQGQHGRLFNASMRDLDQSWRVTEKSPNEAILIARIGRTEGEAEQILKSPNSPTRLWLNELPGSGPRTPLKGTLRQETYIRVFIPVMSAKK